VAIHYLAVQKEDKEISVEQFTGLTDKNGKEGYKSSIIKGQHKTAKGEIVGSIVWDAKRYGWGLQLKDWIMSFECLFVCYDWEICGNIHQNPELMK
jgi:hypothetical protein